MNPNDIKRINRKLKNLVGRRVMVDGMPFLTGIIRQATVGSAISGDSVLYVLETDKGVPRLVVGMGHKFLDAQAVKEAEEELQKLRVLSAVGDSPIDPVASHRKHEGKVSKASLMALMHMSDSSLRLMQGGPDELAKAVRNEILYRIGIIRLKEKHLRELNKMQDTRPWLV